MKTRLLSLIVLSALAGFAPAVQADAGAVPPKDVENSVVKISATIRSPEVFQPWKKGSPRAIRGSGVVIEGRRILTNAHVVLYATQIQVETDQGGDKFSARVEAIAPEIDLAVLKLDDESFFDSHPPLARSSVLPKIKDAVLTYGFPTGGDSLSITKGIVSRIEFVPYHPPVSGLRIQIDAAINPGNSGGPAVVGDKMIGLAFSHLRASENIGYIIPCEEIDYFLKSADAGRPYAKPAILDEMQTLENPALRSYLQVDRTVHGLVVTRLEHDDPAYPLKENDVVTAIGGQPIDDQGMIHVSADLRLSFLYSIQKETRQGSVPLTVVRGGKAQTISLPVSAHHPVLLPGLEGAYPEYFVFGPVVFSAATADFVTSLNAASKGTLIPLLGLIGSPLAVRRGDSPAFSGEQLVVISSPFFPNKLSSGYDNPAARVVKTVNGIPIKNLRHLVEALSTAKGDAIVIKFQGRGQETLVFPRQETIAATDDILADNGVRSQGSPDLLAIWNARAAGPR